MTRMFRRGKKGLPLVGKVDPICPYCEELLDKKPGRKKKCPHCGNYIYVRTRPSGQQRVLVTEAQTEEIEEQWSIVHGTHKEYLARRKLLDDTKAQLTRDGVEPSDSLVRYHLLNREAMEHAKLLQMGLYRNAKLGMADILRKEGQFENALAQYLAVCYIDLNGPSNTGIYTNQSGRLSSLVGEDNPPWNPKKSGELTPLIVGQVASLIEKTGFDRGKTREAFMHGVSAVEGLQPPISAEDAWRKISKGLFPS
jgi:hypothetical protein